MKTRKSLSTVYQLLACLWRELQALLVAIPKALVSFGLLLALLTLLFVSAERRLPPRCRRIRRHVLKNQ